MPDFMQVCTPCVKVLVAEKGAGSPGTGVMGVCELSSVGAGN